MAEARIVSLVPSITELLCDLGLSEQLVALRANADVEGRLEVLEVLVVGPEEGLDARMSKERGMPRDNDIERDEKVAAAPGRFTMK